MTDSDLKRLASEHESQAWRKTLAVGDKVDVLIYGTQKKVCRGWVQA